MLVSFGYRTRHSLVERIDPRARWIFSFLVLFTIVNFWDVRILAGFLALSMLQFFAARLTFRETRRAWLFVLALITTMVVLNTLITSSGTISSVVTTSHVVFETGFRVPLTGWPVHWALTEERLWFALSQYVRLLSISSLFIVLPFTMDPRSYGATFRGLGLGDRVAFALDLAFRFVPTFGRDFQVTLDAQRARGYEIEKVEGGLIAQVRRTAPLLVPVTMNSILSGEDIANAMDLRAFGLHKRTWLQEMKYRWWDYAWIGFGVFLLVGSLVLVHVFHVGGFWYPS